MAGETEMYEMIRILADFPEELRKRMILDRFKMIAAQNKEQRVESVKAIILAVSKLDPKKKKKFIRTQTNALIDAPPQMRQTIQVARVKAGTQIPEEVNRSDMMNLLQAYMECPKEKHQKFVDNIAGVLLILCPLLENHSMKCSLDWL